MDLELYQRNVPNTSLKPIVFYWILGSIIYKNITIASDGSAIKSDLALELHNRDMYNELLI